MTWPTILAMIVGGFCAFAFGIVVAWVADYAIRRRWDRW